MHRKSVSQTWQTSIVNSIAVTHSVLLKMKDWWTRKSAEVKIDAMNISAGSDFQVCTNKFRSGLAATRFWRGRAKNNQLSAHVCGSSCWISFPNSRSRWTWSFCAVIFCRHGFVLEKLSTVKISFAIASTKPLATYLSSLAIELP